MNALRRQLKLPGTFPGMKKAVSTTNLSDSYDFLEGGSSQNLTFDSRIFRSKSPSFFTQEFTETLQNLSHLINDKSIKSTTENFVVDDLPSNLSTSWLEEKYSKDYSKQMRKKTSAIMELLTTELNYVNQMQFLLDISVKIFTHIQSKYFSNIQIEDVFLNLGDIYEVNYGFWSTYLYPSYENAMKNNEFISTKFWKEGFNEISSIFFPYQTYCAKMVQCQRNIQSLEKENKHFSQFSQWFSHLDQANRESLSDFIAKPFQRLTKYKLLLSTIGKYSDDIEEQKDMIEMVNSVNLFLKQVEMKISIAQISMRIDPMEIVEPPTDELWEFCLPFRNFDLTTPIHTSHGETIRELKKESVFKLKEAQSKILEVSCLLFTDLILICQKIKNSENDKIKIIRPIISLKKLHPLNPSPGSLVIRIIDDFGCLTAMYLLLSEPTITHEWLETIQNMQTALKDINHNNHFSDVKTYLSPRLNVISSSPVPEERDCSNLEANISKSKSFNRSTGFPNNSFIRSNFRSSPVIRKRRIKSEVKRTYTSLSEDEPSNNMMSINRSLSHQHSSDSHLSVLEDDFDQPFVNQDCNSSANDFHSSSSSLESDFHEELKTEMQIDKRKNSFKPDIHEMIKFGKSGKLKDSRAYNSMVNLQVDS